MIKLESQQFDYVNRTGIFLLDFVIDCFYFLTYTHFYKFFLNRNGSSDGNLVSFTKNEYGSLV